MINLHHFGWVLLAFAYTAGEFDYINKIQLSHKVVINKVASKSHQHPMEVTFQGHGSHILRTDPAFLSAANQAMVLAAWWSGFLNKFTTIWSHRAMIASLAGEEKLRLFVFSVLCFQILHLCWLAVEQRRSVWYIYGFCWEPIRCCRSISPW